MGKNQAQNNHLLLLGVILVFASATISATTITHGGKHYKYVKATLNRNQANAMCNTMLAGASLATVDSKELNDKLEVVVGNELTNAWLAYTDEGNEGTWLPWLGFPAFNNWVFGQPDNGGGFGEENCVYMDGDFYLGHWLDEACENTVEAFICESYKPFPAEVQVAAPVDGGYSPWTAWTACSKSCGSGTKTKSRTCTMPPPSNGGKNCLVLGAASKYEFCTIRLCPVNGGLSVWSPWSPCTKTCGTGTTTRTKACTNPPPLHGGKDCKGLGATKEEKDCNPIQCAATASVKCTPNGFAPTFSKSYEKNSDLSWEVHIGGWKDKPTAPCFAEVKEIKSTDSTTESLTATDFESGSKELAFSKTNDITKGFCGGKFSKDSTHIEFTTKVDIVVTKTKGSIKRASRYEFELKCKLTRAAATLTATAPWTIQSQMDRTGSVSKDEDAYTFPTSLDIYLDAGRSTAQKQSSAFSVKQGTDLFLRISETTDNPLFRFVTKTCWSTPSTSPTDATKDIFWDKKCPSDETVQFTDKTESSPNFDIQVKSFYFTGKKSASIYFHCDLFICYQTDKTADCKQKTIAECNGAAPPRKRRSTDKGDEGAIEVRTITSQQKILLPEDEFVVPVCSRNSVYDRRSKKCSSENVIEIKGIYLDLPWKKDYNDTTTVEFKELAAEMSYKLYTLIQFQQDNHQILGVNVVKAREGSIILDVQIIHNSAISSDQAFGIFKRSIQEPVSAGNRLVKLLEIRREKVIEFVEVGVQSSGTIEKMTLAVVVVAVLVAFFIIAVTVGWKFRQVRSVPAVTGAAPQVKSFENPSLENVA